MRNAVRPFRIWRCAQRLWNPDALRDAMFRQCEMIIWKTFYRSIGNKLKGTLQGFVTDSFNSSGEEKNSFVLVSGGGEEAGDFWVAKVLLLFRIGVRGSNKS